MKEFFIKKDSDGFYFTANGERIYPKYDHYIDPEDYENDGLRAIEPMSAKEAPLDKIGSLFLDSDYYVDEKLDGVRATMHLKDGNIRIFSRRVSVKTNWYSENTDRLPQFETIEIGDLGYTILDGELIIPDFSFKEVSGTLNCLPEEAIERQYFDYGFAVFKAFDILEFDGKDIKDLPLGSRREILDELVTDIDSPWLNHIPFYNGLIPIVITSELKKSLEKSREKESTYRDLYNDIKNSNNITQDFTLLVNRQTYYQYIIFTGGEGVMLKHKEGIYEHKRSRHYQKVKKVLSRDVIVTGFTSPTKEYTGKFPKDTWHYWYDPVKNEKVSSLLSAKGLLEEGLEPVTKNWFDSKVGNIQYGVLTPSQTNNKMDLGLVTIDSKPYTTVKCGECGGLTDEERGYFTSNRDQMVGTVIEVQCNEVFKETGKLRHPRFIRMREDKSPFDCKWEDHISG